MKESILAGVFVAGLIAVGYWLGHPVPPWAAVLCYIAARIDLKIDKLLKEKGHG